MLLYLSTRSKVPSAVFLHLPFSSPSTSAACHPSPPSNLIYLFLLPFPYFSYLFLSLHSSPTTLLSLLLLPPPFTLLPLPLLFPFLYSLYFCSSPSSTLLSLLLPSPSLYSPLSTSPALPLSPSCSVTIRLKFSSL
ncbi:hypothetical protein Pcinc_017201 [Petrolisthes cinctipes]|uniref:Uncharacterized protein n=1 Tax=Petrolisthes cinctipes TaxID=88211 RepID=A0AAE1KNR4_PETCI|nr:hypothetical protein Pcinc_017201 [Petrolisthes cinctipes]